MRLRSFVAALAVGALMAQAANAALDRYWVRSFALADFGSSSPKTKIFASEPGNASTIRDTVVVDRAGPTLRKLLIVSQSKQTTFVITFNGFIWFVVKWRDGPTGDFTATAGTLGTSNAGSINWPVLTGWTITGATFCNANPSFICSLAVGSQLVTVDPDLRSTFYDVGTWEFHGTGFTGNPFVFFTSTLQGNSQVTLRGSQEANATVPALPLLGVGALGASLFAMGVVALRRRR